MNQSWIRCYRHVRLTALTSSLTLICFRGAKYEAFRRRCFLAPFLAFYIVAQGCFIGTSCKLSILLLITDRIFIFVRFFFGDAVRVANVFLEMFSCLFQQFDRLACVSKARFIGLFLDPLTWFKLNHLRLLIVLRVVYTGKLEPFTDFKKAR